MIDLYAITYTIIHRPQKHNFVQQWDVTNALNCMLKNNQRGKYYVCFTIIKTNK